MVAAMLKRPAAALKTIVPVEKRLKTNKKEEKKEKPKKRDARYDAVTEGIEAVEGLPQSAVDMLTSMLEHAMGTCKEKRDHYQQMVVDMIDKIFQDHEAFLENEYNNSVQEEAQTCASQDELRMLSLQKNDELEAERQSTLEVKQELARAAESYRTEKDAVAALTLKHACANKDLKVTVQRKELLESAMTNSLRPLLQQGGTEDQVSVLVTDFQKFEFDSSMIVALPGALSKAPENRTPFDLLVLNQVEEEANRLISTFDSQLRDAEPDRVMREQEMDEAQRKLKETIDTQLRCAQNYNEAKAREQNRETDLKEVKNKLASVRGQVVKNRNAMAAHFRQLNNFRSDAKGAFESLRERSAEPERTPIADENENLKESVDDDLKQKLGDACGMEVEPEMVAVN